MRRYGMDSMWIAVAFGLGIGLGYTAGFVQFDEFRHEAADRMFYVNGKWIEPGEYEKLVWGKRISGDGQGSGSDFLSGDVGEVQIDHVTNDQRD